MVGFLSGGGFGDVSLEMRWSRRRFVLAAWISGTPGTATRRRSWIRPFQRERPAVEPAIVGGVELTRADGSRRVDLHTEHPLRALESESVARAIPVDRGMERPGVVSPSRVEVGGEDVRVVAGVMRSRSKTIRSKSVLETVSRIGFSTENFDPVEMH